ncbi:hypothetical protein HCN44_000235 [Aphidius gifuensis]|uniref:TIR domain-containing protein n=1 Tax=Aphidius gifuensis TaxID=684658 RepID=A0A834XRJ4_APHGI|nr:hypothetical protein HCN44_000235 [Aphidius gifuensis]
MNDAFEDLKKLTHLYLENNRLRTIEHCHTRNLFELKTAILSHNNLTIKNNEESSKALFKNSTLIEKLDLDDNQISGFCFYNKEAIPGVDNATEIILSNNKLTSLSNVHLHDTSYKKIKLYVSNNNITSLFYPNESETSDKFNNNHVEVFADNNPLNCDCNLHTMIQHRNKANRTIEFRNWTIHMDNLKCNEPSLLKNTPIEIFESKTYKCLLNESNINYAKCPDNCSCWRRPSDNSSTIIDCSSKNLTSGPNSIHLLFGHQIELNLSNNLLSSMPLSSQSGYGNVTILDLSYNNITHLTHGGLPAKLKILYMHNNKLIKIENNVLGYMRNSLKIKELTLHENSFECECDLEDLSDDLQNKNWSQSEKEKITCGPSNRQVYKLSKQELCPPNYGLIITSCIVLAFVAIDICIVIIIFYRYEEIIKIWLYEKQWLLFWVTEEELDRDKYYDAFISYSQKDHDFVVNNLVKNLEKGQPPFKLCVHERDWLAGEQIPTQIIQSIENSKRTIVVLSSNFLESDWANIEFRTAHRRALEDRRTRVIVIKYGELPPIETFDRELQSYLSMYTYLEWKDPSVWSRLRFVMPHRTRSRRPQCTRTITIDNPDEMTRETHL